jgi:hypothetical protein
MAELEIYSIDVHIASLTARGVPAVTIRDGLLSLNEDELSPAAHTPALAFVAGYFLCWADAALNAHPEHDRAAILAVMLGAADALTERMNGQWN